jgi:mycothiol system anti-sigma-R factor
MSGRNGHDFDILPYLDNELSGGERDKLRSHLKDCADCRALLQEEQELSRLLRRSRPLYAAPATLRARVSAEISQHAEQSREPIRFYEAAAQVVWQMLRSVRRFTPWKVLAPAALALALCLILVPETVRRVRAADYVETAVAAHRSYQSGDLAPEIRSDSARVVTAWVADRVPFHFCLPAAQSVPDSKPIYRLTGARLLKYKQGVAAMIAYETPKDKITLLVASSQSAVVAGGDELRFGPLAFHYHNEGGFEVITWSNHGLSYALVSSLSGSPRQSCLVCHQHMADDKAFRTTR